MARDDTLTCPQCKATEEFEVCCPEYKHYIYRPADDPLTQWDSNDSYDVDPIPDAPYTITCRACGHVWEEEPWE